MEQFTNRGFCCSNGAKCSTRLLAVECYSLSKIIATPPIHTSKWMCSLWVPAIIAQKMCRISLSSLADCNAANECSSGGARLFFCNRMADDQVAASGGKEDLKRGRTRGTPGSPSRTEEDTLTDFATSVFRGRFSYRGFCLTLMAFRINKETLAGEIFQLARAYKDGGPPN